MATYTETRVGDSTAIGDATGVDIQTSVTESKVGDSTAIGDATGIDNQATLTETQPEVTTTDASGTVISVGGFDRPKVFIENIEGNPIEDAEQLSLVGKFPTAASVKTDPQGRTYVSLWALSGETYSDFRLVVDDGKNRGVFHPTTNQKIESGIAADQTVQFETEKLGGGGSTTISVGGGISIG